MSRTTVFDIDPALFDRSELSVKLKLRAVLQDVVRYYLAVPRYLTADSETQIPCYLTAVLVLSSMDQRVNS